MNLPKIAMESANPRDFMVKLNKMLKLCEKQLIHRWDTIRKLRVKDVPFVFGEGIYMGSENLKPDDTIESALKNGTFTIGFLGGAEACYRMFGKHHAESTEAWNFLYDVVKRTREFCDECSDKYDLNFSVIATPAEGLSGRFLKIDKRRIGTIEGVTDKEHYTNSYHVPVSFEISIEDKIKLEAPFHELCNGGHISYIEMAGPPLRNVDGLLGIINFMVEQNMGYVGFNFPIDFCKDCGYLGVINDACPGCNGTNIRRTRRVTGYFSTEERIGSGKADEISRRVGHAGREIV